MTETANDLILKLKNRFSDSSRYAVLEQIASGTGAFATSWIDAGVICLWPSDGMRRLAFEVKISRSDFMKELQNPAKNAWARDAFHEFWFVAPSTVIKEQELPEGVGWMKPSGNSLQIVRAASRKKLPRTRDTFLASIIRSMKNKYEADIKFVRKEIKETDPAYVELNKWKDVAKEFLIKNGFKDYECLPELSLLEAAASDEKLSKDKDQIQLCLSAFQSKMFDLIGLVIALGSKSLTATDELGNYLQTGYGIEYDNCLNRFVKKTYVTDKKRIQKKVMKILRSMKE